MHRRGIVVLLTASAITLASVLAAMSVLAQEPGSGINVRPDPKGSPAATQTAPLRADWNETIVRRAITLQLPNGGSHTGEMILTHFRPKGTGPFPVVVMNHGRPNRAERAKIPRQRQLLVVAYWVRRGFAVLVPTRIGYGELSQQVDPEAAIGGCLVSNFRQAVANIVAHTRAAVDYAREQPWADAKRVIVMGVSYGGFGAVGASASDVPGLIAAVNVSGGLGGSPKDRPEKPCNGAGIGHQALEAGRAARAPMLWLYAENDHYWGSTYPRQWHQAYVKGGGKAEFIMMPPVSDDGHDLLSAGFTLWRRALDKYLAGLGFATPRSQGGFDPSDYAKIDDVEPLAPLSTTAPDAYKKFLQGDLPRAFALSPSGGWAWRADSAEAVASALAECNKRSKGCRLYAVDDIVVWKP